MKTLEDFLSLVAYCRDRMNPYMFVYALSVAILHRPDTKNVQVPALSEVFPEKYMDGALFERAKEESNIVPVGQRVTHASPVLKKKKTTKKLSFTWWHNLIYRNRSRSRWTILPLIWRRNIVSHTLERTWASISTTGIGISYILSMLQRTSSGRTGEENSSTTCTNNWSPGQFLIIK
jgi:hypothetical protein